MISNSVDDSQSHPEHNEIGNDRVPAGSRRSRRGVPRWFAVVGCCVLVVWACLTLYDYQHVAAPAARRLWSLDASDRLAAIHELEGSGRVDTGVAIPALIKALKTRIPRSAPPRPWPWFPPFPELPTAIHRLW